MFPSDPNERLVVAGVIFALSTIVVIAMVLWSFNM